MLKHNNNQRGFALLISLIVVGVVVSVGLTILDLTIKQLLLSTNSKDSEIALHAANAGLECAQYWRNLKATDFEDGNSVNVACFDKPAIAVTEDNSGITKTGSGNVHKYKFQFDWGNVGAERCSMVTMVLFNSDSSVGNILEITNMNAVVSGYPDGSSKKCEAGGRCAVISVQGYNRPCANALLGSPGTLQREVLLES